MKNLRKTIGLTLVVIALIIAAAVAYVNSTRRQNPAAFSSNKQLEALWRTYKIEYLEKGTGRTLDKQRGNITTSEGQSYTLLRAVWQDDRQTFDKTLKWTNDNLGRKDDELFAWKFGQLPNGKYGVLTAEGGENTASDADTDIAMALIFAARRWQDQAYLDQARKIVDDIWEKEVAIVNGKPYLLANQLEKSNQKMILNPSYLSPAAYRMFAKIDKDHDWNALVDSSYELLDRVSGETTLAGAPSNGLPPDWITIDKRTGELAPPPGNLTTNYSYDAMRVPFRLALDYRWYDEPRAKEVLDTMSFLEARYKESGRLAAGYAQSGRVTEDYEAPAMYGASSGYFAVAADPGVYEDYYRAKLASLYNPDTQSWRRPLAYYDDNWAWFGLALHDNALIDLSQ